MSEQKRYTAQEMRDAACRLFGEIGFNDPLVEHTVCKAEEMLRYAADVVERCEDLIARLPYPPNGNDVLLSKKLLEYGVQRISRDGSWEFICAIESYKAAKLHCLHLRETYGGTYRVACRKVEDWRECNGEVKK